MNASPSILVAPRPPTIAELGEAGRWQALAAAEDRPAWREACAGIAAGLRDGWQFKTTPIEFADDDAASDWIETNALARRNLQPQQAARCR